MSRINRVGLRFLPIAALVAILLVACGGGGGGATIDPRAIVLASGVVPADEATSASLNEVKGTGALHFTTSTPQTDALQPGEILLIGITEATPEGFFGRVVDQRAMDSGVGVVVYTEPVALSEVISQGVLELRQTLTPADVQSVDLADGVSFTSSKGATGGQLLEAGQTDGEEGFYFALGGGADQGFLGVADPMDKMEPVLVFDGDDDPSTTDDQVWAVGDLHFRDVTIDFGYRTFLGVPVAVVMEVKQGISSSVRLYGSYSGSLDLPPVHIATISFTDVEVGGGGGRFVLGPYMAIYMDVSGEINVDFSAEVSMEAPQVTAKATFPVLGVPEINGDMGSPGLELVEFHVAGDASLQFWAYGEVGVKIAALGFSAVDVSLRAGPFVEVEAALDRGVVAWALYGGAKGNIGASVAGNSLGRMEWTPFKIMVADGTIVITSGASLAFREGSAFDYGAVGIGESADHLFWLDKGGDMPALQVVGGGLVAPFTFRGGRYPGIGGTCGGTVYQDCTIAVRFAPLTPGGMNDRIVLSYEDGHDRPLTATKGVIGTGLSVSPATLRVAQGNDYDFGTVEIGQTKTHTFQVIKGGDLIATLVDGRGLDPPFEFKGGLYPGQGGTCGETVASDCTIVVSFTPLSPGSGSDRIELTYFDGKDPQSASANIRGTGGSIPLVVTIDDPTQGQVLSGTYILSASTSGGAGVSSLEFHVDGRVACIGTATSGRWSCPWDTRQVGDGAYGLTAVAVDANANRTSSSEVLVKVNNPGADEDVVPPAVAIISPVEGEEVSGSYRLVAAATDNVSVASVAFFVDGSAACTGQEGVSGWSCSWNSAVVDNGRHEIVARALDPSGNAAMSLSVPIEVSNGGGGGAIDWRLKTVDGVGMYRSDVGRSTSLAYAADGTIHISYRDSSNNDLKYAWKSAGGVWSAETVDSSDGVGSHTSIAVAADGTIHISYYNYKKRNLNHAWGTSGSWRTEVVDSTYGGGLGYFTSIAIAPGGIVHISYSDSADGDLKHARKRPGMAWAVETVDSAGNVGNYTSIMVAADGTLHISYYDTSNGNLKHAWRPSGGAWSVETVESAGDVGYWTSFAVASNGSLHISYLGATNGYLRHAWKPPGGAWLSEAVDSIGYVGEGAWGVNTSIAITSDGTLHISYGEGGGDHPPDAKNNLKHAWRSPGGAWSVETVDTGSVGLYTSIAIGTDGMLLVSYYDVTNGDLKFAWASP